MQPHGGDARLPVVSTAAFLPPADAPSQESSAAAPAGSEKLPAAPAKRAQSRSEKPAGRAAWPILLVRARLPARRVPSPSFRTCCAPALPPARLFLRSESAPLAPVFRASSTPAAAKFPPNPGSRASPAPGSPDTRASPAPPAGSVAPGPASSAPISSPPAHLAPVSPCISASSPCPQGSHRSPPHCLFSASPRPSPVLFFSVPSAVSVSSVSNSFFFLPDLLRLTPSLESLPLYFLASSSCSNTTTRIAPPAAADSLSAPPLRKKHPAHRCPDAAPPPALAFHTVAPGSSAPPMPRCESPAAQSRAASPARSKSGRRVVAWSWP